MMALCDLCSSLTIDQLPTLPSCLGPFLRPDIAIVFVGVLERSARGKVLEFGYRHQPNFAALAAAAVTCELCALILGTVRDQTRMNEEARKDLRSITWSFDWRRPYQFWISQRRDGQAGFYVLAVDAKDDAFVYLAAVVGLCVEKTVSVRTEGMIDLDDALSFAYRGRLSAEPGSEESLEKVSHWIGSSNENHEGCSKTNVPLPFRVLDIGEADDGKLVRLLQTNGEPGTYTTLSHCWGTTRHFTTTSETMFARQEGFLISQMPKTFQDAVTITRRLRVRYLWIDSLCICQDDRADWERESAKMSTIYANSYLTISTMSASNDMDGYFKPHIPREYVKIPHHTKEDVKGILLAFTVPLKLKVDPDAFIGFEDEPLMKRAWALQERLLSSRIIYNCSDQMHFECKHQFQSEDGYQIKGQSAALNGLKYKYISGGRTDTVQEWFDLVSIYNCLDLTKSSDKLPALSGLAKYFEEKLQDQYIAGLWRRTLPRGLLWESRDVDERRSPEEYRAPSWSWAATDGPLRFLGVLGFEGVANIVDAHIQIKGENPHGEIRQGWIKLHAPLIPVYIPETKPYERFSGRRLCLRTGTGYGLAYFDLPLSEKAYREMSLFGLVLARLPSSSHPLPYPGLLVTPAERQGERCYRRVGTIHFDRSCKVLSLDKVMISLL